MLLLCCLLTAGCSGVANSRQQVWEEALFSSIKAADAAALQQALKNGASPNARNGNGGTALCCLIQQYKRSQVKRRIRIENCTDLLLQHEADPEALHHGFTPLQVASGQRCESIVAQLIRHGADPDRETRAGLAPIWGAVYDNNYRVGLELLKGGANPNALNRTGETPLEYLRKQGHSKTQLMILLRHYGGR